MTKKTNRQADLHRFDEPKEKAQGEYSYGSGADQMVVEERERQREEISQARPEGSRSQITDDRVIPEGMGGAGGGDIDDLGDVANPKQRPG